VKLGAENKKKVVAMAVLVAIAILIGIRAVSSFGVLGASTPTPPVAAVTPVPAATTTAARPAHKKGLAPQVRENTLDPRLRTDILQASQKLEYEGGKRNIFRMEELPPVIPQPVAPVVINQPPPGPPPPPPPPPITLRFFGFASRPGEPKKVFLAEGTEVFVAKEGDIVDRRYRIVQINNNSVLVEDVLNNSRQSIQLTTAS
jgi:hypothetical protein